MVKTVFTCPICKADKEIVSEKAPSLLECNAPVVRVNCGGCDSSFFVALLIPRKSEGAPKDSIRQNITLDELSKKATVMLYEQQPERFKKVNNELPGSV